MVIFNRQPWFDLHNCGWLKSPCCTLWKCIKSRFYSLAQDCDIAIASAVDTRSVQSKRMTSLQWRHNGHDNASNHQPHDCLLNRLFRRRSKKTLKLRVTGLCAGNSPETGEFPAQRAVTRKMFPFGDVIMIKINLSVCSVLHLQDPGITALIETVTWDISHMKHKLEII